MGMTFTDDEIRSLGVDNEQEYIRTFSRWERLLHRVKSGQNLDGLDGAGSRLPREPRTLSNSLFVSLVASFADPTQRKIWRELILDLIADDLAELIAGIDQGGE